MRSTALSLTVIALALAAIVAGYVSGQSGTRPPPVVQLHPRLGSSTDALFHETDSAVSDAFSDDDVVVDRPALGSDNWYPQRLAFVVGLVGDSAAIDSTFLRLNLPLAFDLDPRAAEALKVARLIHTQGEVLLLHVDRAPSPATLAVLRAEFGEIDGIASRNAQGQAAALAGSGLEFFDERGDADPEPFLARDVPFVARDTTVDDHSARSYIAYMLGRAAVRSERQGRLVVLMRPLPNSLAALDAFARTRSAQIVALTPNR
jgi:polysaccharide deacetylase 2 family uncharacterized protein YibQ